MHQFTGVSNYKFKGEIPRIEPRNLITENQSPPKKANAFYKCDNISICRPRLVSQYPHYLLATGLISN